MYKINVVLIEMETTINTLLSEEFVQKIYHISDIHIRLYHRLDEYEHVFQQLYVFLEEEKQHVSSALIVITGDILHHKNELSPECIVVTHRFLARLSSIFPTIMIAGNHDALLNNRDRMDSLSAILHANPISRLYYLRDSGFFRYGNVVFGVSSLLDGKVLAMSEKKEDWTWIALFHGGVGRFSTAKGHVMEGMPLSRFDGYDLVMLGDIHLFQYLDGEKKRIAYSGSLISQNFTETDPHHGVLIWNIPDKTSHFHRIENPYAHCDALLEDHHLVFRGERIDLEDSQARQHLLSLLPEKGRMAITLTRTKTAADVERLRDFKASMPQMQITEKNVVRLLEFNGGGGSNNHDASNTTIIENHDDEEAAFQEYFQTLPEEWKTEADTIYPLLRSIHETRGGEASSWDLLRLEFDHMFGYGEGNVLDFQLMHETIGIFGENSAGKSSLIEIIVFMLYGQITRYSHGVSVPREVIHFREKKSRGMLRFRVGGIVYEIEKHMTLLKSQKIRVEEKLWKIHEDGVRKDLSEEHRKKTDKFVISRIGSCQQFLFTTIFLQQNEQSFRSMSPRDRKDFLYKILDLDRLEALHIEKADEHRLLKKELERMDKELARMSTTRALQVSIDETEQEVQTRKEEILCMEAQMIEKESLIREQHLQKRHDTTSTASSLQAKHHHLQKSLQEKQALLVETHDALRDAEMHRLVREQEWGVCQSFLLRTFGNDCEDSDILYNSEWEQLERLYKQRVASPSVPSSLTSDITTLSSHQDTTHYPTIEDTVHYSAEKHQSWTSQHHNTTSTTTISTDSILFREKEEKLASMDRSHDRSSFASWSLKKLMAFKEKQTIKREELSLSELEREKVEYERCWEELDITGLSRVEREIAALDAASDQASRIVDCLQFSDTCGSCTENRNSLADHLEKQESRRIRKVRLEEERMMLLERKCRADTLQEKIRLIVLQISILHDLDTVDVLIQNHGIKREIANLDAQITAIEQDKMEAMRIKKVEEIWERLRDLDQQRQHVVFMNQHVEKEILVKKELLKKIDDARKSRIVMEDAQRRVITTERNRGDLKREIVAMEEQLVQVEREKGAAAYNEEVEERIRQMDREKEELRTRLKTMTGEEATLSRKIWSLNQELEVIQTRKKEHDDLQERLRHLQVMLHVTGRDGYPMFLLQRHLPRIEEHLNEMIAPFLGGKRVAVRSEQKKESINILLYVMNGDSETIYVGGMEGFMIDAALKIVFTRISMQPRCGMFMIDEGISALDKKNMENLDQFFQFLEQFFPRVFIISHLREAQEFVQSSIHVRKDPLTQKSRLLC